MTTYKVGYFVGSLAKHSINRMLAKALQRLAPPALSMFEIPFKDLPLYSYDYDADFPPVARAFKDKIAQADALLFVTPEYNRSIPGGLKNAIDWASRPYGENAFTRKPSAVIGASVGAIGTAVAQQSLRSVLSFCNSPQMNAPEAYIHFTPGLITDEGLQPQLLRVERGGPDRVETAVFDWEAGFVTLHDNKTAPLDIPTFDPLALMWQYYFTPPTEDNVTVTVDAVAYFQVVDPVASIVRIRDWFSSSQLVAQTTLRSIVGRHELDRDAVESFGVHVDVFVRRHVQAHRRDELLAGDRHRARRHLDLELHSRDQQQQLPARRDAAIEAHTDAGVLRGVTQRRQLADHRGDLVDRPLAARDARRQRRAEELFDRRGASGVAGP